jgi:L-proline amide hydrolase
MPINLMATGTWIDRRTGYETTPTVVKAYLDHISDIRWALFEDSSHMPHVEERMACMETVVRFLDECL